MGAWQKTSSSHVANMSEGDFYGSEKSVVLGSDDVVKISHFNKEGHETILKDSTPLLNGEVY